MSDQSTVYAAPASGSAVDGLPGFEHRYGDAGDVRLHYVIGGAGPAVVLIHGWPFTWVEWKPLLPLLAAKGFTVIAPDLRGSGDSSKPKGPYTKRDEAADIEALITQLGFDDVNVVGTDIGTMVAHAFAASYPKATRRLVLSEALLPGFGLEDIMNPAAGGSFHFGFHAQVDLAEMLTTGKESEYLGVFWAQMSNSGLSDDVRAELLRSYRAPGGMRGGFEHYATLVQDGTAARDFPELDMPVLVLNGDHGLPHEPLLHGVRQVARQVEADIVPGSGHTMGLDNPKWLAERLAGFFA